MTASFEHQPLAEIDWLCRCATRIQQLDEYINASEAAELARTLWSRPSCRRFDPETIAERLHNQVLSASQWGDL